MQQPERASAYALGVDPVNTKIAGINIVLVGSFNPRIFQPAWFAANGLIPEEEGEHAHINIIHPDLVSFRTDWFELSVEQDRFAVTTQSAPSYEPVRDLIISTFSLLEHTPIAHIGINYMLHHRLDSENSLRGILDALAPAKYWQEVMKSPWTRTVTMQSERPDEHAGSFQVTVEPSVKVESAIFVATNDHVELPPDKAQEGAKAMIQTLTELWEPSAFRFEAVADRILTLS